jgi:hypothetical protein
LRAKPCSQPSIVATGTTARPHGHQLELREHVQRWCCLALPQFPADAAHQIHLNNRLYDVSEMTIPTDNVDEEQLQRPNHWDTRLIRRFMLFFGPISSLFNSLPFSPFAHALGFTALPVGLVVAIALMIPTYLLLLEIGKLRFYRIQPAGPPLSQPSAQRQRRIHHRASRWSIRDWPRRIAGPHPLAPH